MKRLVLLLALTLLCGTSVGRSVPDRRADASVPPPLDREIHTINGKQIICEGGVCRMVDAPAPAPASSNAAPRSALPAPEPSRLAQGYMTGEQLIAFLRQTPAPDSVPTPASAAALWQRAGGNLLIVFLLALLGGLAMNLTPCVLPMVPVTLMVIGRSAKRGAAYGAGMALAYGALGLLAAFGGVAFGAIQGKPWFNLIVALLFAALGLALSGAFALDFSRGRARLGLRPRPAGEGARSALLFPFGMGVLAAVLAGACVAPILVAVLLLTADLFAQGQTAALALPFAVGLGLALPWPFAGAGLKVLPKPGAWMRHVNRAFALILFAFAVYYGLLAFGAVGRPGRAMRSAVEATPETFEAALAKARRPVFVDCWASWCKNCAAMERVFAQDDVQKALAPYTVIRLQAEDMTALTRLAGFADVKGLPAFKVIGAQP